MPQTRIRPTPVPCNVRQGPLQPHLDEFADALSQQGYRQTTQHNKTRLVLQLNRWLEQKRIPLKDLDDHLVGAFLENHWSRFARRCGDRATLRQLLQWLRQARLISEPQPPGGSELELLERDYQRFLLQERGLVQASVDQYLRVVRRFLSQGLSRGKVKLKELTAGEVIDFVSRDSSGRSPRYAPLAAALRSFLGFLLREGRITANLAAAVPAVAGGRLSELPRALEAAEVEKLLRHCDRRTKTGQRDYAILLLLARLGLRAGEVAYLNLEDIDWEGGQLCIRGKGSRMDRLPLPPDVGQALAAYLQKGRPSCSSRRVFIRRKAPHTGFARPPAAICDIVRTALERAELHPPHTGAHLLRHSLATRMLGRGASLAQIGQILRHRNTGTTEIYAKVHLDALRALAQPWLGGAP